MAKDDYEVIVYRMLVYLYAVLKREIAFDAVTFAEAVRKDVKSRAYFDKALEMMQEEGLIRGLVFVPAWGGDVIMASGIQDAEITPAGIRYLKENARGKRHHCHIGNGAPDHLGGEAWVHDKESRDEEGKTDADTVAHIAVQRIHGTGSDRPISRNRKRGDAVAGAAGV